MKYLLLTLAILVARVSCACDACSVYEFSPLQAKSFVGLFYSYSFLNGYSSLQQKPNFAFNASNLRKNKAHIGHIQDRATVRPSEKDYEAYQRLDARLNYNLKNKWNFLVNIPLQRNSIYYHSIIQNEVIDDSLQVYSGIGDILIAADKVSIMENNTFQHTFKYGIGLFLPTGQIDYIESSDPAHYTGRGSLEPLLRLSYSVKVRQTWGALSNISYSFGATFSETNVQYEFGNRLNAQLNFFYAYRRGDYALMPTAGTYFEEVGKDKQNKIGVEGTGGRAVFLNLGTGLSYKNFLIRGEWQAPFAQQLDGNQLMNAGRLNIVLLQNF